MTRATKMHDYNFEIPVFSKKTLPLPLSKAKKGSCKSQGKAEM
jgi:hypothetical protein